MLMAHSDMGEVEPTGKSPIERLSTSCEEEEMIPQERNLPAGTAKASQLQGFGGHHCSHWILVPSTLVLGVPTEAWLFSVENLHPSWCPLPPAPRGRGENTLDHPRGKRAACTAGLEPAQSQGALQKTEAFPGLTMDSAGRRGNKMVKFLTIPCLSSHSE